MVCNNDRDRSSHFVYIKIDFDVRTSASKHKTLFSFFVPFSFCLGNIRLKIMDPLNTLNISIWID